MTHSRAGRIPVVLVAITVLLVGVCAVCAAGADALPSDAALNAKLLSLANASFKIKEVDHFTIAYDTPYAQLTPLVGRLEGTRSAVVRFCIWSKLPIHDRDHRLGVLFFDCFEDFRRYADERGLASASAAGFYSHDTNVAAFASTLNSPAMKTVTERIERLQRQLSHSSGRRSPSTQRGLRRELVSLRAQRDAVAKRFNQLVIQHEAAHQILYNLGVHVRGADNPQWLVEGLACQFEVSQSDRRGRITRVNHMRLADLRDALGAGLSERAISDETLATAIKAGRWLPLRRFIVDAGLFGESAVDLIPRYAQAWGLVHYLFRKHPTDFADYLRSLMARRAGVPVEGAESLREFERAFGPVDEAWERRLIDDLLSLRLDRREAGR